MDDDLFDDNTEGGSDPKRKTRKYPLAMTAHIDEKYLETLSKCCDKCPAFEIPKLEEVDEKYWMEANKVLLENKITIAELEEFCSSNYYGPHSGIHCAQRLVIRNKQRNLREWFGENSSEPVCKQPVLSRSTESPSGLPKHAKGQPRTRPQKE